MGEVFKKIKEATEKDAGELFATRILPMYVGHDELVDALTVSVLDSRPCFMNGSWRPSLSPRHGFPVG